MWNTRKKLRRYEAACRGYEDRLLKIEHLHHSGEQLLSLMRRDLAKVEDINDALVRENRRLSENADTDSDLVDMLYADNLDLMKQGRKVEDLEQENDKLWVENILLKAELLKLAPEKAREIGNRG